MLARTAPSASNYERDTVTTTVNVGYCSYFAAVNSVTNKIYVPNNCRTDINLDVPATQGPGCR